MLQYTFILLLCVLFASAAPIDNASKNFEKMGALSRNVSRSLSISDARNELDLCRPVTVIYARGTIETGNVGSLAGPPFFNALNLALGADNVAIQGVDYSATILGYLRGGDSAGSKKLASLTQQAAAQCPETQIVLSGYSQGAQLVHNGVKKLPAEVAARIAAVVLFGDPYKNRPLLNIEASKVITFCFDADLICKDTIFVSTSHLAYAVDAVPAAQFVASKATL